MCKTQIFTPDVNYKSWREQQVVCQILDTYNKNVRPQGLNTSQNQGGPVLVYTSLRISSFDSVNDALMQIKAQFRFQQKWFDKRLTFEDMDFRQFDSVDLATDQIIWNPDTFFQNERSGHIHLLDRPNLYTRIRSDGLVIYDKRMSMVFACPMVLKTYPHDTQICHIDFATYAYTTDDIEYIWDVDPIIVPKAATKSFPKFKLISVTNDSCTSKTNTGTYSCLRVEIVLERVFSYFLLQLYIPSIMLVLVSYVSYWIDWRATAARVPLSIVTLLTMVTQSHAINQNLPPVSYTKAIDVWISGCVVFIFGSLIEYAIVNYTGINEQRRRAKNQAPDYQQYETAVQMSAQANPNAAHTASTLDALRNRRLSYRRDNAVLPWSDLPETSFTTPSSLGSCDPRNSSTGSAPRQHYLSLPDFMDPRLEDPPIIQNRSRREIDVCPWLYKYRMRQRAERIDLICRIVFPFCFLLFNCVYWAVYW